MMNQVKTNHEFMKADYSKLEQRVATLAAVTIEPDKYVIDDNDDIATVIRKIYTNPMINDKHSVFAGYLGTSRQEAKALSYMYTYTPDLWK